MRDILFRGIGVHGNKEWIEGDLVRDSEGKPHIVDSKYVDYCHGEPIFVCEEECEVIPETVGQYTGLTDKNGKKIFEGDIIKADNWVHSYMKIYTIVFEYGGFYAKYKDEDGWNFDHLANIEVIENVFDNPELLEVK